MLIKQAGGSFQLPNPGPGRAVCINIIDVGTHLAVWQGKSRKRHSVRIIWELSDQIMDDGRPMIQARTYTASLNEKSKLYAALVGWRGRQFTAEELNGFELDNILGKACTLNLVHEERDGKTYCNIASIAPLGKNDEKPVAVNELLTFSLDKPDSSVYEKLPEFLQNIIAESDEGMAWLSRDPEREAIQAESAVETVGGDELDDDIPF